METRRIRRLERRRTYRIATAACALGAICVAVGMALPQSTTVSVFVAAIGLGCLAMVVIRRDSVAPVHGLGRVVRLPLPTALSATVESYWSRLIGSLRALAALRPNPVPLVLDEPDDEAAAWWGTTARSPLAPYPGVDLPAPPLPAPVLSAPMRSADVAADAPCRLAHVWAAARRQREAIVVHFRHPVHPMEEVPAGVTVDV